MRTWSSLVIALLILAVGTIDAVALEEQSTAPKNVTLVLGDSLAFGYQGVKFFAGLPDPDPAAFEAGFADAFIERLAATAPGKRAAVVNLACPGETTTSFLDGPCSYNLAFRLHQDYAGPQISAAEAVIGANPDQVSPILISVGANDVLAVADACDLDPGPALVPDPDCVAANLPGVLVTVAANLAETFGRIRAAAPAAVVVALQYYNPLEVVLGPSSNALLQSLNAVMAQVAAGYGVRVANAFPAFNITGDLCALTLMCASGDVHPSDAGYAVIADLMFDASGYTRYER